FFEMLGNFSIGDYFKEGAIVFAWELVRNGYGLPEDRLYVTCHPTDDESPALWRKVGVPQDRIFTDETNWWAIKGSAGPCGPEYEPATHKSMRVLADHGRSMTFLVGDGLEPGNEGRGYILRRIIRRAVRHGRLLGLERPFLRELATAVIERMAPAYANLKADQAAILEAIAAEEAKFNQTLAQGMTILDSM